MQVDKFIVFFRVGRLSETGKTYSESKYDSQDLASNNVIKKVVGSEFKWEPTIYKEMYWDDIDEEGLLFWYNTILQQIARDNQD